MRFDSIHIQQFGRFENEALQFDAGPASIVCGQNEAGKSTLLEFLRQLLFGFPLRNAYHFRDGEMAGAGQLTLTDGRRVEVKRRKGRKNALQVSIGGADAGLDDAGFAGLLGHATENVFRSTFAFGLHELRQGDESLKDESLRSALFAGGLGGAFNPESILKGLSGSAEQLFKPRGTSTTIHRLAADIKSLATEVRKTRLRGDEYVKREEAWQRAQAHAEQLGRDRHTLHQQFVRTANLFQALPHWRALSDLRRRRAEIDPPPGLPGDAASQFERILERLTQLRASVAQVQLEYDEHQRRLEALNLDQTVLPWRSEIEECHRLIQSVADARRDLPGVREQRARLQAEIEDILKKWRPGWSVAELQDHALTAVMQHELDKLCEACDANENDRRRLTERRAELQAAQAEQSAEREALGAVEDVSALRDFLERLADMASDQKRLQAEPAERRGLEQTLHAQRGKLNPRLPIAVADAQSVLQLPVPSRQLVAEFDQRQRELTGRGKDLRQRIDELEGQRRATQKELETLVESEGPAPSVEDLTTRRQERDAAWQSLRATFLEVESQPVPRVVTQAFEQSVRTADEIADQIYRQADVVASREQLRRRELEAQQDLTRLRKELETATESEAAFQKEWSQRWEAASIEPESPEVMRAWLEQFSQHQQKWEEFAAKETEWDACRQRLNEARQRLQELLGRSDEDLRTLLAAAKERVAHADETAKDRKRSERDLNKLAQQLRTTQSELDQVKERQVEWGRAWSALLEKMDLPAEWEVPLTQKAIAELRATQEKLKNLQERERRIRQMEERIEDFDPRVLRLCEKLNLPIDTQRPEVVADSMHQRLTEAMQTKVKRESLEKQMGSCQDRLRRETGEVAELEVKRQNWLERAGVSDDAEFRHAAEAVRVASELDADIRNRQAQLETIRGVVADEIFTAELETADGDQLAAERDRLQAEVDAKEQAANEARELAGKARGDFEELNGGDAAALLQEQMSRKQAELANQVHRYVPMIFAHRLLQQSIERFERENQPELIGSISRLLSLMTHGRYTSVERPLNDPTALLVVREDGTELLPQQLSTATREQLYLAIRLGYILHYCRQSESLPIVMDDVFVNFDVDRSTGTLEALREVAGHTQVLFFTCHEHMVERIQNVFRDVQPVTLGK